MSTKPPIRVVLADDHTLLREGLRRSLEDAGMVVVAEGADGQQAVALAAEHRPDVVLMDVSMPGMDGVEATKAIRSRQPEVDVVILTMHADHSVIEAAVRAGAAGYLVKDCTADDIVGTIEAVAGGDTSLSPGLASSILADTQRAEATAAGDGGLLTPREHEVLTLIAQGMSTPEVAKNLYISTKTVRHHLSSIYDKLDSRDRTQAVLRAVRMGIVRLE